MCRIRRRSWRNTATRSSPKKENWEELHGDIEFKDVTFRYPDGDENILEHFNLKVPQGTNVAIVGETGAGKSTLVNLVCRFYEPTEGQVLIDGRDARERSQLWLHSNIGYVLQTPHLFSGTVLENLRYGRENATDGGDRSGGQSRLRRRDHRRDCRTAIRATWARAATAFRPARSSFCPSPARCLPTRASLCSTRRRPPSIRSRSGSSRTPSRRSWTGSTSFVIAHRLSTIRRADVILVVNAGRIVERGSHAELMAKKGVYYGLYTRQYREEQIQASMENE